LAHAGEEEVVLPPLCLLRVAGPARVESLAGGRVAGVDVVGPVTNARAGTLEELLSKRKQVVEGGKGWGGRGAMGRQRQGRWGTGGATFGGD
jgi:hypothetical protein